MNRRTYFALCIAIVLIAGGFRYWRITERSLWLDEARVANYARQSFANNVMKTRLGSSSPITYPLVLQAVQRVHDSVFSFRSVAAVFSLLAIITILALPRYGFDRTAALVAGAVLAVSPSQIRYAQEVREYSLSVFIAAVLVLALVGVLHKQNGAAVLFLATFFLAPLVQYGLVFLAVAVLIILVAAGIRQNDVKNSLRVASAATLALAVATVITYLLTLRGQWGRGGLAYLAGFFFNGSISDVPGVVSFLAARTGQLLTYLTLGRGSIPLLVSCLGLLLLVKSPTPRDARLVLALALISIAIVGVASVLGVYPFGPIRQDLFLAPVIAAAVGLGWTTLATRLPSRHREKATVVFLVLVLASGSFGIVKANPYQEIQDVKSVIAGLEARTPGDVVYVSYGAHPAFMYYKIDGPEFVFGASHRGDPAAYITEFRTLVGNEALRVWVAFSHANYNEIKFLLTELSQEWSFEPTVKAPGVQLYLGRRIPTADASAGDAGEGN